MHLSPTSKLGYLSFKRSTKVMSALLRHCHMTACLRPPLTWWVVSSPLGRVIPKTIIQMVQTASLHGTQCLG